MKKQTILVLLMVVFGLCAYELQADSIHFTADGEINDGEVYLNVGIWNDATVDMYGGIITNDLGVNDQSIFNLWGGSVGGIYNRSIVNIYGGEVTSRISLEDESSANIYNGNITGEIDLWDSALLNIYGGNLDLYDPSIPFSCSGTINIYGYGFNYNPDTDVLTGFLSDDNPFSFYGIDEEDYTHFNLIPEPATIFLFAITGLMIRKQRL